LRAESNKKERSNVPARAAMTSSSERQAKRTNCVEQYESLGFVQAQNLTAEQRDSLPPKPTR
jgi:hypothetical protein